MLAAQTLVPEKFEVLIINNNSTDQTEAKVLAFLRQHEDRAFRYIFEPNKGLSFARQRAVLEAKGDLIVFFDDDAEPQPDVLALYLDFFANHPEAAAAGGTIIPKYSEKPKPKWMSKWLDGYVARSELGGKTRIYEGNMKYPIGCNMGFRKQWILDAGGFNTDLAFRSDDKYIYLQVKKLNPNIYYIPEAVVYHNIPGSRLSFDYLKTLYLKTGNEEKVRISKQSGALGIIAKFAEFIIKFGISLALWLLYTVRGEEIKGRYIMYSQWFVLLGFLRQEVFVR